MKERIISTVAVLAVIMLLGSITGTTLLQQQASAIICWKQFQELSDQFEKNVIDIAEMDDTTGMQRLLDEYSRNVMTAYKNPC